jgi:predicted ATPase/DNA-binding XRE family transcriptional regulator
MCREDAVPANSPAFGNLLRHYRRSSGLSQEALAERAGLSLDTVRALERGRSGAPRPETLARLVEALGLDAVGRATLTDASWPERSSTARDDREMELVPPQVTEQELDSRLPIVLSSFVGRERERAMVRRLLERARLVTLTGTGGVGKSRLALAAAEELLATYRNGVWLVDLAPLTDPTTVADVVLRTLGLREEPGCSHLDTLIDHLRGRQLLLILDNCEHLLAACARLVAGLLGACASLRVLATSREGLGLMGEQRYRVPPLGVPGSGQTPPLQVIASCEAVSLFVARAQERQTSFALDEQTAPLVAAISARLDGIPLAIELAAARVESLPLTSMLARLDHSLELLTSGSGDLPLRQRTLQATLDWSYGLLVDAERMVFRRLSLFADGWTLEAAEYICADGVDIQASQVFDLLGGLIDASLVVPYKDQSWPGAEARFSLLATIRQYAQQHLTPAECAATGRRHLEWYTTLAHRVMAQVEAGAQDAAQMLALERANLQDALALAAATKAEPTQIEALSMALRWLVLGAVSGYRRRERPLPDVLTR